MKAFVCRKEYILIVLTLITKNKQEEIAFFKFYSLQNITKKVTSFNYYFIFIRSVQIRIPKGVSLS